MPREQMSVHTMLLISASTNCAYLSNSITRRSRGGSRLDGGYVQRATFHTASARRGGKVPTACLHGAAIAEGHARGMWEGRGSVNVAKFVTQGKDLL